ncbi:MAG: hypothetical protein J0H39_09070 [Alphaproteobacteria bacterium]|nr:hypothetical protein [Alphaproteobacteria bacterium]
MMISQIDIAAIRSVLANMDPKSAVSAARPMSITDLYAPPLHSKALRFNSSLVVGNRGAGKSVWSGALADKETRMELASHYDRLGLDKMVVVLGFHEDAGKVKGVAPSPLTLSSILANGVDPETIWMAVLLKAIATEIEVDVPSNLRETVNWMLDDPERFEAVLRKADHHFGRRQQKFLLVFDAVDRLANSWDKIRPLSQGILRLGLSMLGFENMRAKIFLRTDQEGDEALFNFPDASKIRAMTVRLAWHSSELYGLLFSTLERDEISKKAFQNIKKFVGNVIDIDINSEEFQRSVFSLIAGEFMGADHRRGRTYTWLIDHLADAFHETSPRSFLIALQRAASSHSKPSRTVIDHHGIREGVQAASAVRVNQLEEDYPWIQTVLGELEGLEVPCKPDAFIKRWVNENTVAQVMRVAKTTGRPGPIGLEGTGSRDRENSLLEALKNIGVVEERSADRINMPDIFRVAAKIKRRGGVRPPSGKVRRK